MLSISGMMQQKIYNVTMYKVLKLTKRSTIKVPLATETLISLNIIGWLRCNYYHEYLTCEQEDFCETIHLVQEY